MNRRGFLAALFAPVLAPFLPKVPLKPKVPGISLALLNEAYQQAWTGRVLPDRILCSPEVFAAVVERIRPEDRLFTKAGGLTFNGAQILSEKYHPRDLITTYREETSLGITYVPWI